MFVEQLPRRRFPWREGVKEKEFRAFGEDSVDLYCKKDT